MRSAVKRRGRGPAAAAVAVAALLPLMIGGAGSALAADPAPPGGQPSGRPGSPSADRPGDQGSGNAAVPLERLVPGVPLSPHERHVDTPDQALPPLIPPASDQAPDQREDHRDALGRGSQSGRPGPLDPPLSDDSAATEDDRIVEYVPPEDARPDRNQAEPASCTAATGPYQREVERFLNLPVDGEQSEADCEVIRQWQIEQNIEPAIGFAGPSSGGHIRLVEARPDPNADGLCPVVPDERVACLDLPRQLMWVQAGEDVVFGPVAIRSGKPGYPTRVGWNRVYWKNREHFSTIYKSPMPYAQFFNGGQAIHGAYGNIYDPEEGSYGCVNLKVPDARDLWDVLFVNDRVYSWGRRPGT
ncbi:L,D-transpeptidase family protein [Streptomyces sp. NPDC004647]|uniref:L,D-transpeptidase n=1 Tax=Streptomyces sp. NPDC004647 TaxID=3154671 RepID=UPI0033A6A94E